MNSLSRKPHDSILDPKIENVVKILQKNGVETCQSCQGGEGHAYDQPTVEFRGGVGEGPRAYGVAVIHGLPVTKLSREWGVQDNELTGPHWAMEFNPRFLPVPSIPEGY